MARRTKAREVVVQMLYLRDLNPDVDAETVHALIDEQLRSADLREFAWRLFVGVIEFRDRIDERIQDAAENWAIKRMAPTDRNVLRLGAYELLQTDTPHRVVLDEAIEVAKRFGGGQSPQFVNGVLDHLVPAEKRKAAGESPREPSPEGTTIVTESLRLVPATEESLTAALAGPLELGNALGVTVPGTWPPEHFDDAALEYARDRLAEGDAQDGWWTYFFVHAHDAVVVGAGGFKGPPNDDGLVEIGYSVVPEFRRRGYAKEAVRGLVKRAFETPAVRTIVGDTLPLLTASIRTLESCGFQPMGTSPEPGVLRFAVTREGLAEATV